MKTLLALLLFAAALPAATVEMGFTGAMTGINDGSYYVGPYNLTIDGVPTTGVCITWDLEVGPPYLWIADLQPVSAFAPAEQTALLEADWLALQFTPSDEAQWVSIHHAIWDLFGASYTDTGTWLALAAADYGSVNPNSFLVAVPTPDITQSFLIQTPEPRLCWIGLGFLVLWAGFGWYERKRRLLHCECGQATTPEQLERSKRFGIKADPHGHVHSFHGASA